MSSPDQLQHFLFTNVDIRGQLVGLEQSYHEVLANQQYPEALQKLIGEFMAAAVLLSGTIKIEGTVSIQAQGDGDLSLIMAECRSNQEVRAIAKWQQETKDGAPTDFADIPINEMLGKGQLAITIDPEEGQRYQGIVPLEGGSLSSCLEAYFDQSEQLKTRIWLYSAPGKGVAGVLLQAMPSSTNVQDQDAWPRICLITDTLSTEELLELKNVALIYRLYHEEEVSLYPPATIRFKCSCSRERTINAMVSLGQEEIEQILAEQPEIAVQCEFCHRSYRFQREDLEPFMMEQDITEMANDLSPTRTLH